MTLPRLARRAAGRRADAGDRPLGDRGARRPVARPHGARGQRAGRRRHRGGAERARRRASAAAATTAATATSPRGCCATPGREVRVVALSDPAKLEGDAKANLDRLPGEPPRAWSRRRCSRRRGRGRRDARHRVLRRRARAGARGDLRAERLRRAGRRRRRPERPRRLHRARSTTSPCAPTPPPRSTAPSRACGSARARSTPAVVRVIQIGMPAGAPVAPAVGLLTPRVARRGPAPRRASTKFSSGHVLVAGGSRGLTGAPCLAAEAAMRAGAGYVTCCVPAVAGRDLRGAPARGHDDRPARRGRRTTPPAASSGCSRRPTSAAARSSSGPGLGKQRRARSRSRATSRGARQCRVRPRRRRPERPRGPPRRPRERETRPTVLTPHAGELARLLERRAPPSAPSGCACARGGGRRARRSSSSRATTRSSPRPGGPRGGQPGRCARPRDGRDGRRPVRRRSARCSPRTWTRSPRPAPGSAPISTRAARAAADRAGRQGHRAATSSTRSVAVRPSSLPPVPKVRDIMQTDLVTVAPARHDRARAPRAARQRGAGRPGDQRGRALRGHRHRERPRHR